MTGINVKVKLAALWLFFPSPPARYRRDNGELGILRAHKGLVSNYMRGSKY